MGAHHSREFINGEKRRRKNKNNKNDSDQKLARHTSYTDNNSISTSPKYSPFYRRTNSSITVPSNPVNPVRHQVVLSDQIMPLSSLMSIASHVHNDNKHLSIQSNSTYRRKSTQKEYDTISISGLTSDDDDRTKSSSSRSALYASSIDSASSMQTPPSHVLHRQISFSDPIKHHPKNGPIVFDTTIQNDHQPHIQRKDSMRPLRHYVLKQVFGGNIQTTLINPKRILDSGCGIGLWTWEVSQQYLNCDVIGIDIHLPDQQPGPWGTTIASQQQSEDGNRRTFVTAGSNISFVYGDVMKPLPFDDNSFDYIHQLEGAMLIPSDHWQPLLTEFHRILKVGGKIELVEHVIYSQFSFFFYLDIVFNNPGPVLTMMNEWYRMATCDIGVSVSVDRETMNKMLSSAGFDEIQVIVHDIPIGEWPDDPVQKQHGFLYKEQIRATFKSAQRWWIAETGITQQEYDRVCAEAMEEFEDYSSSVTWRIYTATKSSPPS
ncbi:S-adenosyl-L-methionine-dependent methyltransferase [Halteromyces radiatus]|uniref:S-adenosyl-L-methionine-dependent methyltransferase n=1 Tax=Halteromyces radiatus TaxID=101107 RepID=UPI00221E7ACA|nr:S-adenosyl-L-methionine-dependent methyltransferase [Halteromyces radiatus]KAI8086579.1 S-adenosyl-L-methionine-dependent methyltransferase [Halteromyces radiatus]